MLAKNMLKSSIVRALICITALNLSACTNSPDTSGESPDALLENLSLDGQGDLRPEEVNVFQEEPNDGSSPDPVRRADNLDDAEDAELGRDAQEVFLSATLCEGSERSFPRDAATTQSASANFAFQDSLIYSMTASVGDIDGDGRTDLLIGDEAYLNCGDEGFAKLVLTPFESLALSWI